MGRAHTVAGLAASAGLLAAVVACTVASVASGATTSANAARAVAGDCPSFRNVYEIKGHARLSYSESATGVDTSLNGTETITLDRSALVTLNLTHRETSPVGFLYTGTATASDVAIKDTLTNTGSGYSGEEHADGVTATTAFLSVESAANRCRYELAVEVASHTVFSGDPQVEPNFSLVGQSADSGWIPILHPEELAAMIPLTPQDVACFHDAGEECYSYNGRLGGWGDDFDTLLACGSVEYGNCQTNPNAVDKSIRAHLHLQLRAYQAVLPGLKSK